jgi:two-component system response regulator MprA
MSAEPLLLLVGASAVALAPRLAASGYSSIDWLSAGVASSQVQVGEEPLAAVLAADQASRVRDLRQRFGAMPILLDLEQDSVDARAACLCVGADDFWLSSIGPSDLLLRLRLHRTVQARLGQRPTLLELGDLSLDPATRQVRRAGRTVALTAREFALLLVLMRSPGQVFSREQLLQEVWQDERASSNVVEVYVRYLRQKLEADGESRLLLTVRGRGYSLGPLVGDG